MVLFHRKLRGIQIKNPAPTNATVPVIVIAPITQHAIRYLRLGKMRRYICKIASFGKAAAGPASMGMIKLYFAQATRVE